MATNPAYKQIRLAGFVLYIPFVLATGPLSGYFLGSFLQKNYGWRVEIVYCFILFGFLASAVETVRIIRLVMKNVS